MPEEKETKIEEELDEDFADAVKEEAKAEPEPEPVKEPEKEPEPEPEPEPESYEYSDESLSQIEIKRQEFYRYYKKNGLIKMIVSISVLVVILLGWILPSTLMKNAGTLPLIIALGIAVVGVIGLAVMSFVSRKANDKHIKQYFNVYYDKTYEFVFKDKGVTNIEGYVDAKITKDEFLDNGMYPSTYTVGSRDNITFSHEGLDFALCDAAAQKEAGKGLATIFVGKYLRAPNTFEGSQEGLVIYFKGNDRALPPETLTTLNRLEETSKYTIYGSSGDKKFIDNKIRSLLKKITTDKVLVDVAIAIKPGKTYFCLGYEDSLMVLPMQKPFNPAPTEKLANDMAIFLDLAHSFNKTKEQND